MRNNQACVRCVNDKTIKNISFDAEGVCNFCRTYEKYEPILHNYSYLEELFLRKIKTNETHAYDVAVGISGGKDSTFVLYELIYKYKLKVCTYTLDNGFLSEEAKEKINRIVQEFHVPHEYVNCNQEVLKEMYHYIVKKYLSPCIACSFLGYAAMINYASRVDAYVGIHGRSIPQMLRNFSENREDYFKPFILDGLKEEGENPELLFQTILDSISTLVDQQLATKIKEELLKDAYKNGFRPFLAYFLYHPYNKDAIIRILEENTSWRIESEEEHFDCLIHHGALHIKNIIARRHHLMPEISVMVREKMITREEAHSLLKIKDNIPLAKKELKHFCEYADLKYCRIMLKAKLYGKRWW